MKPIRSNMTDNDAGPPELDIPFSSKLRKFAPPYSLPFVRHRGGSGVPTMCMTEWRPTAEDLQNLMTGGSIYVTTFGEEQPMISMTVSDALWGGAGMAPIGAGRKTPR